MSDHYFSAEPVSPTSTREIGFDFLGERIAVQVDGGVFSATKLDSGTKVLLKYLESYHGQNASNAQNVLDLGCGWGPITISLAKKYPDSAVLGVDINRRALRNTARNLASTQALNAEAKHPDSVPDELEFDEIWSNPPIRIGKKALHELLLVWLPRLKPLGVATLVVAKQLGAPSLLNWLDSQPGFHCTKLLQDKGYWLLRVKREG